MGVMARLVSRDAKEIVGARFTKGAFSSNVEGTRYWPGPGFASVGSATGLPRSEN